MAKQSKLKKDFETLKKNINSAFNHIMSDVSKISSKLNTLEKSMGEKDFITKFAQLATIGIFIANIVLIWFYFSQFNPIISWTHDNPIIINQMKKGTNINFYNSGKVPAFECVVNLVDKTNQENPITFSQNDSPTSVHPVTLYVGNIYPGETNKTIYFNVHRPLEVQKENRTVEISIYCAGFSGKSETTVMVVPNR